MHTIITSITLTLLTPLFAFAEGYTAEYTTLVNIPGVTDGSVITFAGYVNALYALCITVAAVIVVIRLVLAGATWALSEVITDKSQALQEIKGSLVGLLIILLAFVILQTINPQLTNIIITPNATPVNPSESIGFLFGGGGVTGGDPADLIDVQDTNDLGQPRIQNVREQSDEIVQQFNENCVSTGGTVLRSGDGSQRCVGSSQTTESTILSSTEVRNLLPTDIDPAIANNLVNQFEDFIAPFQPASVDIEGIKERYDVDEVLFIVQNQPAGQTVNTLQNPGAEEAVCSAMGGFMETAGTAFRGCFVVN